MQYPWYDAIWLWVYTEARSLVAKQRPERLADFEAAFEPLQAPVDFSTRALPGLISPTQLNAFRELVSGIARETLESHEFLSFGREVVHDHPALSSFQDEQTAYVSELAGEVLTPCYNFISLYNNLGICEPHLDAPTSKWTLDICVEQSEPWPIYVSDPEPWPVGVSFGKNWQDQIITQHQDSFTSHVMQPGDALFFAGGNQWHYRKRIPKAHQQSFCHLIFLHYVPANCEHLLDPAQWPVHFDIPELGELSGLVEAYKNSGGDSPGVDILTLLDAKKKARE